MRVKCQAMFSLFAACFHFSFRTLGGEGSIQHPLGPWSTNRLEPIFIFGAIIFWPCENLCEINTFRDRERAAEPFVPVGQTYWWTGDLNSTATNDVLNVAGTANSYHVTWVGRQSVFPPIQLLNIENTTPRFKAREYWERQGCLGRGRRFVFCWPG